MVSVQKEKVKERKKATILTADDWDKSANGFLLVTM